MKRYTLVLLAIGLVIIFTPIKKAQAAQYLCISAWSEKEDAKCTDTIEAANDTEANDKCQAWCVDKVRCFRGNQGDKCPVPKEQGCFIGGADRVCENVTSVDPDVGYRKCKDLCAAGNKWAGHTCEAISSPCPALVDFYCMRDGECVTIQEYNSGNASVRCKMPCDDGTNKRCETRKDPCPKPRAGALSGATPEALKTAAAADLNKAEFSTPVDLINRAVRMLTAFIGSISLVLYIWSGLLWMTARGEPQKIEQARKTMIWTTLGVVVMLASYMLVSLVFKSLGV